MDAPPARGDSIDIQWHDFAVWESCLQFLSGGAVGLGVAELLDDYGFIADIKTHITGSKFVGLKRIASIGRCRENDAFQTPTFRIRG